MPFHRQTYLYFQYQHEPCQQFQVLYLQNCIDYLCIYNFDHLCGILLRLLKQKLKESFEFLIKWDKNNIRIFFNSIHYNLLSLPKVSSQFPFRFVGGLPGVMVPVVFIVHRPLCGAFRLVVHVWECRDDNGCKSTFAPQVSCWGIGIQITFTVCICLS